MPRRKTFRVNSPKPEERLHLRVSSPRILGFRLLRVARRTARLAAIVVLLGVAVWGAKSGMRSYFIENGEFQLRVVDLETNGAFAETDFARETGIDPTASVFAINLGDLQRTLESFPCIVSAEVSRRLPGTLRVKVEERVPVAWLECRPLGIVGKDPDSGLLVDDSGVCFPCAPWWDETASSLPVILVSQAKEGDVTVGKRLRHHEARRALELMKLARERLTSEEWRLPVVAVRNDYSLLAATDDGLLATFGMYDHERQIDDLVTLVRHTAERGETMESVNLIPERNIPVRLVGDGRSPAGGHRSAPESRVEREVRAILGRGEG